MGHALGLKHPFDTSDPFILDESVDNEAHTVMSYTAAPRSWLLSDTGTGVQFSGLRFHIAGSRKGGSGMREPLALMPFTFVR